MIFGIGTDICDVRRIEATFQRQGERFVRKVLSDAEVQVWQQRTARSPERGIRYLATRFSAKEAFSKAVGLGMRLPMTWRRCEIANAPSGQPLIVLHGDLKQWFEAQGLTAHVSVTDETDYAASYVVVERGEAAPAHRSVALQASVSDVATNAAPLANGPAAEPVSAPPAPPAPAMRVPVAPVPAPEDEPVPAAVASPVASALPVTPASADANDRSILGRFGSPL